MSDSRAVFGRILSAPTLERGVERTLRTWCVVYLAEVLAQAGYSRDALPDPREVARATEFRWEKDGTLPLIVVATPGTTGDTVREADSYTATWEIEATVLVDLGNRLQTREAAQFYAAAVGAAMAHQGVARVAPDGTWLLDAEGLPLTLEGSQVDWLGEAYRQMGEGEDGRSLVAGGARLLVTVEGARSRFGGPEALPPDPTDRGPVTGPDAGLLKVDVDTDLVRPGDPFP